MAFVAASTSSRENPEGTPSAVTIPSHSSGDLLVIAFCSTSAATPAVAMNTPSGWNVDTSIEAGDGSAVRLSMLSKIGDGVESSVNITLSGTVNHAFGAVCAAYSSTSATADVTSGANTTQESGVDITSPSVTTTVANTTVIYAYCFDGSASTEADHDSDAGFNGTSRGYIETVGGGGDNGLAVALSDEAQAGIGASNTCVWSSNADDDAGCASTVAFGPSGGSIAPIVHHRKMMGMQ